MAGKEFQGARDSLVAELSAAKKVAGKTPAATLKRDGRKNRKSDPLASFMKENNIQKQFLRMGAGLEG